MRQVAPSPEEICCFLQFLQQEGRAPPTVKNVLSLVKFALRLAEVPVAQFDNIRVKLALDALTRSKVRLSLARPPVPLEQLVKILERFDAAPDSLRVRLAILLMFYAGLRQSEVAPATGSAFDPTRHATKGDAYVSNGELHLRQKWAKNLQRYDQHRVCVLAPSADRSLCPVETFLRVRALEPSAPPHLPLLTFQGSTAPMTSGYVGRQWKKALLDLGLQDKGYTLHSVRKAAATTAYGAGCRELEVRRFGGWSSDAANAYIRTADSRKVNSTLVSILRKSRPLDTGKK